MFTKRRSTGIETPSLMPTNAVTTAQGISTPADPLQETNEPSHHVSNGRRARHRQEVFDRLVCAAKDLLLLHALEESTVQEITDRADVGKGTFFNYFESKEHVIPELVRGDGNRLQQTIEDIKQYQLPVIPAMIEYFARQFPGVRSKDAWMVYYGSILHAMAQRDDIRLQTSKTSRMVFEAAYVELMEIGQARGEIRTDLSAAGLGYFVHDLIAGICHTAWIEGNVPSLPADDPRVRLIIEALAGPRSKPDLVSKGRQRVRKGTRSRKGAHSKKVFAPHSK